MNSNIIILFNETNLFFTNFFYNNLPENIIKNKYHNIINKYLYLIKFKNKVNPNHQDFIKSINFYSNFNHFDYKKKIKAIDIIFNFINDVIEFYYNPSNYIKVENIYNNKITICIKLYGIKKLCYDSVICYYNNDLVWNKIKCVYNIIFQDKKIRNDFFYGKIKLFFKKEIINNYSLITYLEELVEYCLEYERYNNANLTNDQIYEKFLTKYKTE